MTWLLTPAQRRVLQLAAGGASNAEIGRALGNKERTVKNHLTGIFKRLKARSRVEAVVEGIRLGEVDELQAYADLEFRQRCELENKNP
jgi:DNA-binding CsgD family transcriptional regulator